MCKIIRSECWRQVRFYRDCLRVSCGRFQTGRHWEKLYRRCYHEAELATESLWNAVRPVLPKRGRHSSEAGTIINLGDTPIPERFQQTLRLGPRFNLEPSLRGAEKVALARNVSSRVPENERCRCTSECVAVLVREEPLPKIVGVNCLGTQHRSLPIRSRRQCVAGKAPHLDRSHADNACS
ncbi:hypothetical protein HPB52_011883 [Rhipicephalus sanguineus]|uniref:Uncharacterized protein n=1 Tax=Rhipicephalus sanguineus TaxID=34632 RepID=A0A9D4QBW2_RHISA|nr:hypothetical protein HPB52_011883 [Rhipicephalus sanguineus]